MPVFTADQTSQLAQPDPAGTFLLVNNDETNPVYIGQQRPVTAADPFVLPQGSTGLTGTWYVSTLDPAVTVQCFVIPGGHNWQNPVGVQISLNTLGLAKDTTVAALPGMMQALGIPPFIPNAQPFGAVDMGQSGSPYTIVAAQPTDTFIWYAHLSLAGSSNASHVGNDQAYAMLRTGSGKPLVPTEIAVGDAASADSDSAQLSIGGVLLAAGDTIVLDVNGGLAIAEVEFRAACVVILGTP